MPTTITRQLPFVLAGTLFVLGLPMLLMIALNWSGLVSGGIGLAIVGAIASMLAYWAGERFWQSREWTADLLFNDVMPWGWIRRLKASRELRSSVTILESLPVNSDGEASRDEQITAVEQLARSLEARDAYTHGHSSRVARHATRIARELRLPDSQVALIRTAAAIHDIGKVKTPKEILNKPGALTDEEFDVVKLHPVDGAEMAESLHDEEIVKAILHHHERLDGGGYPAGLSGDEIPLASRIIAVADSFDAITSKRPYRDAKPHKVALDIIRKEAGKQLDPVVVDAFLRTYSSHRFAVVWAVFAALPGRAVATAATGASATNAAVATNVAALSIGAVAVVPDGHKSEWAKLTDPGSPVEAGVDPRPPTPEEMAAMESLGLLGDFTTDLEASTPGDPRLMTHLATLVDGYGAQGGLLVAAAGGKSGFSVGGSSPGGNGPGKGPKGNGSGGKGPQGNGPGDGKGQDGKADEKAAKEEEQAAKDQAKAEEKAAKESAKADEKAAKEEEKAAKDQAKAEEKAAKDQAKAEEQAAKEAEKQAEAQAKAEEKAAKEAQKQAEAQAKADEKAAKESKSK